MKTMISIITMLIVLIIAVVATELKEPTTTQAVEVLSNRNYILGTSNYLSDLSLVTSNDHLQWFGTNIWNNTTNTLQTHYSLDADVCEGNTFTITGKGYTNIYILTKGEMIKQHE